MNKEIAMQWADALESGDYKQGKGRLRGEDNRFCCLGVLCNLHAQQHSEIAAKNEKPGFYLGEGYVLPEEVKKWAGMFYANGIRRDATMVWVGGRVFSHLAEANDYGIKFPEIAKYIREHYEAL